ncbi:cytochrome P450 [Hypoxylon trugodes]|uniref:cytochrome P450 n=1 Tax=Hypoxylon trugodes TaxID=326681 RepID=UPI002193E8B0|nr:cytochrome P450 [Hypoxylon trugodes]KAI1388507.1 cytochrome P450 [Hypoxylon trugodes]
MATFLTSPIQGFVVAFLLVVVTYFYSKLHYKRFKQNAHIPQHPPSLLWGHLAIFDKFSKQGAADRHPDAIFAQMRQALGQPPIMVVDNWPIVPPMVIIASHEVAEQVSKPSKEFQYSVPKSPSTTNLVNLIGPNSILNKQNEEWKAIRKRFNPGFAPQHLMTLLPVIVEKSMLYLEAIDRSVATGEAFALEQATTNLTFDIIGAVAMNEDMGAQHPDPTQQGQLVRMYKELIRTYADDKLSLPWWLIPRVHLKRRKLGNRISEELRAIVRRNFGEMNAKSNPGKSRNRSRTVLALSLQDINTLTPEILEETCDQLKTFLFAGHDTTSSAILWSVYELSRTPHALKAVRDELDQLFGPGAAHDPAIVREKLLAPGGDEIVHRMTYISAVLKEVLRLYPPAGSIRLAKAKSGLIVTTSQGEYDLSGVWLYLNHTIIGRDPAVFGDTADAFVPERWLQSEGVPASAYRPFERGPRNCIGQELAVIEARIIIALLAGRFEFTKVGCGETELGKDGKPIIDDNGQFKVKSEMYSTIAITAKPVDGMVVKVKLAPTTR